MLFKFIFLINTRHVKNEFKKHRVAHQSHFLLRAATKPWYYYYYYYMYYYFNVLKMMGGEGGENSALYKPPFGNSGMQLSENNFSLHR